MKLSTFLTIKAVVALLFGLGFLLIPDPLMQIFGVHLDPSGLNVTRILGGYLTNIAVISWLYKDADYPTIAGLLLGFFIGDTAGLILAIKGQLEGLLNPLGWLNVAILLFLAVGFGYFRFVKPGTKQASPRAV